MIQPDEIVVDCFAGGGGASTGIEAALGRPIDIAINHDPQAIAMHVANHPETRHYCENVWDVDPREATSGRPVGLAWFSPDCTFHSKARGGKPFRDRNRARRIRGLAWLVIRWAKAVRPRVIMLENVEEFANWGPLLDDGKPCPIRKGMTFRRWHRQLENLGYRIDMRELRACDYGSPTIRKRLFIVARCDDAEIVIPEPTHGPGLLPFRTAAECIDWSIPCPSIFERKRPLAEATMRRIANGIRRYVIENPEPFIVNNMTNNTPKSTREPLNTILTGNHRYLVTPFLTEHANATHQRNFSADEPLRTQCAEVKGGHFAMVAPFFVPRYGERPGQEPRCMPATTPIPTIVPTANGASLCAAFLAKHFGGNETPGWPMGKPVSTVTAKDHHALVTAHIQRDYGRSVGHGADDPLATTTAGGGGHSALVTSHLLKMKGTSKDGQPVDEPLHTIQARGNHYAEVRAFLLKYYGTDQDPRLREPLHTVTTKDRFGLVTVAGVDYQIIDIGMRMLQPRELFRAQGFPDSYVIDPMIDSKPLTKTAQVRMCGNSVCPQVAGALVRANLVDERRREAIA